MGVPSASLLADHQTETLDARSVILAAEEAISVCRAPPGGSRRKSSAGWHLGSNWLIGAAGVVSDSTRFTNSITAGPEFGLPQFRFRRAPAIIGS